MIKTETKLIKINAIELKNYACSKNRPYQKQNKQNKAKQNKETNKHFQLILFLISVLFQFFLQKYTL